MKLLIYSHFFAPSIGGVETIVLSLARGLAELRDATGAREFDITLVTQTPAGDYDDSALPFRVVRRPDLLRLWRLIRKSDLVHAAGPAIAPLVLARLARKPLVIEHHGYQATCPNGLLFHHLTKSVCPGYFEAGNYLECMNCNAKIDGAWGAFRLLASTFLRRAGSRCAAKNIAPSHHVASRQGLPRTIVIFHGVPDLLQKTAPADPGPKLTVGGRSFSSDIKSPSLQGASAPNSTFAYLGRLVTEKGVSVLLEAARLLLAEGREFRVPLIGDGPERPNLEKQIAASHLESTVRITGFLTGSRLAEALRDVYVVVMPSVWEETAGLAAMEQMMRGRLVIAAKIGGLAEVVADTGLTFPAGDAQALAEAMKMVLKDPSIIKVLGSKARDRALCLFLRERMIEGHALLYRSLLCRHPDGNAPSLHH